VLILDEPTNGIDVEARRGARDDRPPADRGLAVVLISSDPAGAPGDELRIW